MSQSNIKKNFIYNLLSQIVVFLVPVVTTPYLSRVLQVELIGQISYSVSIVSYFVLAAGIGFSVYGQRAIASSQNDLQKQATIFWEIFIARFVLVVMSEAILCLVMFTIGFGDKYNLFIGILSIQVIATAFDIQFWFQGNEDFKAIAIRTVLAKIIGLVLIFLLVKTPEDGWIYTLLTAGITMFCNLIMWPKAIIALRKVKNIKINIFRHYRPALMIFLPTLAITIYAVFDKSMIGWLSFNPDYANGCYDRAYTINTMAVTIVSILTPIMMPRNSNEYSKGHIDVVKQNIMFATRYVFMMGFPLIVGFAVMSNSLVYSYIGPGYEEVPLLLQIMSVRFIVSGFADIYGSQLFIAIGKEKYTTIAAFSAAIVNVGFNLVLIPHMGAVGAAIATSICEITVMSVLLVFAKRNNMFEWKETIFVSWKYLIAAMVMFVPIYFLEQQFEYNMLTFVFITIVGMIVYFVSLLILRDEFLLQSIKSIFYSIRGKIQRNKTTIKEENNEKRSTSKTD